MNNHIRLHQIAGLGANFFSLAGQNESQSDSLGSNHNSIILVKVDYTCNSLREFEDLLLN